jgi:hypothetical protein
MPISSDTYSAAESDFSGDATSGAVRSCPCWIEIELLDSEGAGIAHEPYEIYRRGDSKPMASGELDGQGLARVDQIPVGEYLVRFPERELEAHDDTRSWIEIEMLDAGDRPIADEPFRLILPDGRVVEDTLDASGRFRLDDLGLGLCHVHFPNRDEQDFAVIASGPPRPSE